MATEVQNFEIIKHVDSKKSNAELEELNTIYGIFNNIKSSHKTGSIKAKEVWDDLSFEDGILREHNHLPYKNMLRAIMQNGRALLNNATGTGKSYLAIKYLNDACLDNGKKVLFLAPNRFVIENFETTLKSELGENYKDYLNIEFATYQGAKKLAQNKYDTIICDEAHHLGAPEWGKSVNKILLNNVHADFIGLTATLNRADGLDITQIFGEPVKPVLSMLKSYKDGILVPPVYYMSEVVFQKYSSQKGDIEQRIEELQERAENSTGKEKKEALALLKKYREIERSLPTDEKIDEVVQNVFNEAQKEFNLDLTKGKIIVFAPIGENEQINERYINIIERELPKWFKGIDGIKGVKTYSIHHTKSDEENMKTIDAFRNDKSNGLVCMVNVGMLIEGPHLDDCIGVVMLRPTQSEIMFTQQWGRVNRNAESENKQRPIILDFVANAIKMTDGDIYNNFKGFVKKQFGGGTHEKAEDDLSDYPINYRIESSSKNVFELLKDANFEYENFKHTFSNNAFEMFKRVLIAYGKEHPKSLNKSGRIVKIPAVGIKFTYYDEVLEKNVDYPIGKRCYYYKNAYDGKGRGKLTIEQKADIDKYIDFRANDRENRFNQFLRALTAYGEKHPEALDENGRIIKVPASKAKFTYYDEVLEENVDYPIGVRFNYYKKSYDGKVRGNLTIEQKADIDKYIDFHANDREKIGFNQFLRALDAYGKEHPEALDGNGRIVKIPTHSTKFTYYDDILGETVDYPIGRQCAYYKKSYDGKGSRGNLTIEQKEDIDKYIDFRANDRDMEKIGFNQFLRVLDAYVKYIKEEIEIHPEKKELRKVLDENGRIIKIPTHSTKFTYYDDILGETVDYPIGRQCAYYKNAYDGKGSKGNLTIEQKADIDKYIDFRANDMEKGFNQFLRALDAYIDYIKEEIEIHPEKKELRKVLDENGRIIKVPTHSTKFTYYDDILGETIEYSIGVRCNYFKQVYNGKMKRVKPLTIEKKSEIDKRIDFNANDKKKKEDKREQVETLTAIQERKEQKANKEAEEKKDEKNDAKKETIKKSSMDSPQNG